ncbi:4'-phosphopantetheinyl transferase superfamily protein [Phormidium sp. LEGE 05292]|uniref:4'-phosphopantetheinyl transferase family protein n=1 Tax=[Phormidium] sp. LEGE 05292 TaxID=767427 RepID=UPI00187EA088|nr:4'-phosphopantetheinyl transferase superfamily protein [Phormidium sp. LEGE 05292]MBE9227692.1 4'-phosphopantetheinyl transferase superfamily protein [Phormidium sp. LEGE 05292]
MSLWRCPPQNLTISPDYLHIWRAELDLPTDLLTDLAGNLSLDERQRAEKFYFEKDKKKFIACRGLLRVILSRYLNFEPQKLEFAYSLQGKPELNNIDPEERLCFNVSHSHGLAVYAIALNRAVGIDLEHLRDITDVQQLAERFFSKSESTLINALPESQQKQLFFRFWTIKEAYLKATGEGLAGLQTIAVSFTPENAINLHNTESNILLNKRWYCTEFEPNSEYTGALVVERKDLEENAIEYLTLTNDFIFSSLTF